MKAITQSHLQNDEAEIADLTIDASGVEGEVTLTTDFAAQVATAENATITVNGASYTAAEGALTIDATEDASTLFNGTVALADGAEVTATNGDAITAAAEITVTVTDGEGTTISGLDEGDSFTYSETTYTMTAIGLIDADANLYADYQVGDEFPVDNEAESQKMIALTDGVIDIATLEDEAAVVVDSLTVPTAIYADIANAEDVITVTAAEVDEQAITGIALGEEDATLTVSGFETVAVTTAEGSATYDVNGVEYVANASALEITATADGATLTNGEVVVSSELTTTDELTLTIEGDGDEINVLVTVADGTVTSITGLGEGEIVNYNGKTYQLYGDVIKVTAEGAEDQLYSGNDESTNLITLGETGDTVYIPIENDTLNLAAGAAALADGKTVIYGEEESYEGNYTIALAGDSE